MTKKQWMMLFHTLVITILFFSGFFIGRSTIKEIEIVRTEYIKGDTITNTIEKPIPDYIEKPIDTLNIIKDCIKNGIYQELWPEKLITEYIQTTSDDTLRIIQDWATKRTYEELLFQTDTIGTCNVKLELQYNRLKSVMYNYQPIIKKVVEEKYKIRTFSPFIGIGYMTNPWDEVKNPLFNLNGGVFIKEKYGIQVNFMHMLKSKNDYVGGSFLYKF